MLRRLLHKHTRAQRDGVGTLFFCIPRFGMRGWHIHFEPEGWESAIRVSLEQAQAIMSCTSTAEALALLNANEC